MTIVEDWTEQAACQGVDIDLFFDEDRTIEARRLCLSCPVRTACLSAARDRDEPCGVWGGLTAGERDLVPARRVPKTALVVHACADCDAPLTFPMSPIPAEGDAPCEGSFCVDGTGGAIVHRGDLRRRAQGGEVTCPHGHVVGAVVAGTMAVRLDLQATALRGRAPLSAVRVA
ncbi:MAG: WhiB family transcriptional regulator [Actinomycetota bacterium]